MEATSNRLLRRTEVERRCGITRATIYRHLRQGTFPEPVKVGPKAVRWLESEIDAWIAGLKRAGGEPA